MPMPLPFNIVQGIPGNAVSNEGEIGHTNITKG
jgi:hypothetical protein